MPKDSALFAVYGFVGHTFVIFIQFKPPLLQDAREVFPEL
jgi:hypothetical protein